MTQSSGVGTPTGTGVSRLRLVALGGLGEIGRGEAIACYAVVMLAPAQRMGTEQLA